MTQADVRILVQEKRNELPDDVETLRKVFQDAVNELLIINSTQHFSFEQTYDAAISAAYQYIVMAAASKKIMEA